MTTIQLFDFKGDFWDIMFGGIYNDEAHWWVLKGPAVLCNYNIAPTPVFTEWF